VNLSIHQAPIIQPLDKRLSSNVGTTWAAFWQSALTSIPHAGDGTSMISNRFFSGGQGGKNHPFHPCASLKKTRQNKAESP